MQCSRHHVSLRLNFFNCDYYILDLESKYEVLDIRSYRKARSEILARGIAKT